MRRVVRKRIARGRDPRGIDKPFRPSPVQGRELHHHVEVACRWCRGKKLRQRRRKVIWFNSPYNNRVSTNIGKAFFHLLRKHFPPSNRLHKICNKNVVKLSYSCTPNMANILSAHNNKLLKSHNGKPEFKPCDCRYKPSCPLNGNCRDKAIVYQATV